MSGGPGVPKTFLYAAKREGNDFDAALQEWIPIVVDTNGELRTAPIVTNNYGDEGFPSIRRLRGNENPEVLFSDARTSTIDSDTFENVNERGAHFIIDVTALTGTPSITVKIQGHDPASFSFYDILVSGPITTVGTTVLKVYPGINTIPNGAASDIVPYEWRVRVEHADAQSITYSVGANLVM